MLQLVKPDLATENKFFIQTNTDYFSTNKIIVAKIEKFILLLLQKK